MERAIFGALGGLAATVAMTAAMHRLWPLLDAPVQYPLPPREIIESTAPPAPERKKQLMSLVAHFGFGALVGAGYAMVPKKQRNGPLFGLFVWFASYLGWLPALNILKPATTHPLQRNLLMIAVHLIWGTTLAISTRELENATRQIFAGQSAPDARERETATNLQSSE